MSGVNGLRRWRAVLILLLVSGCALQQAGDYDRWSDFHNTVNAMTAEERREVYAQLDARRAQAPSSMTRLQLAYLMTLDAPETYTRDGIAPLLDGVQDSDELAPIRDMLRQYLQLLKRYDQKSRQYVDSRRECDALDARLEELGDEREALRREIDTCTEQLQALKEIESMMSAADESVEVQP